MNNPSDILFSVIIPTRHRNDLLARCLDRLAPGKQTIAADRYEVIVTDDGSTSTAREMVEKNYPWVRWFAGPCKGPAANRNNGSQHASGQFLAFTDDDCVPALDWLQTFASALRPDVDVYEGKTTCSAGMRWFYEDAPFNPTGGNLPSCNMVVRKIVYDEVGGFDERFPAVAIMEDMDFRDRLKITGHDFIFVPAVIDHPPRKRVVGAAAGRQWEARVFFECKWHPPKSSVRWLPVFITKIRLGEIRDRGRGFACIRAFFSYLAELGYVVRHVRQWDAKYRAMFPVPECGPAANCHTQRSEPPLTATPNSA